MECVWIKWVDLNVYVMLDLKDIRVIRGLIIVKVSHVLREYFVQVLWIALIVESVRQGTMAMD